MFDNVIDKKGCDVLIYCSNALFFFVEFGYDWNSMLSLFKIIRK